MNTHFDLWGVPCLSAYLFILTTMITVVRLLIVRLSGASTLSHSGFMLFLAVDRSNLNCWPGASYLPASHYSKYGSLRIFNFPNCI